MIKKLVATTLTAIVLLPTFAFAAELNATAETTIAPQPKAIFSDVAQTHPNFVAIQYLANQGVIKGYQDGTFRPDQLVNRAEALKIILQGANVKVEEKVAKSEFKDVKTNDWFATYVAKGKEVGIIKGNPDGTFAPGRNVAKSEYIKMLLMASGFKSENWTNGQIFNDVPVDAWFAPYMNYAGTIGIIQRDSQNNINPNKELTRGEVAQALYLATIISRAQDSQFLIDQAQAQIGQIEVYIQSNQVSMAKLASELAVDTTQQALRNMPSNNVVLGAAKIARAYDFVVNSYISAVSKKPDEAKSWADQAITKATEAWEANKDLQPLAKHVKDLANGILTQL